MRQDSGYNGGDVIYLNIHACAMTGFDGFCLIRTRRFCASFVEFVDLFIESTCFFV